MTPRELRAKLLKHGRRPLGKLIEIPIKAEGKQLYADIKNSRAYSYFMVDMNTQSIREGHIFKQDEKKVFGSFKFPAIPLAQ